MVTDFDEANSGDIPSFLFHLGDVVYYFGESTYYYDQFYEPYRDYPAPIIAIPGNHDGVIYSSDPEPTLSAFLRNFCSPSPVVSPDAGGLSRTTMIQPGVYFTLDAPFVKIVGLYSNVLEDPGVISSEGGANTALDDRQLTFLAAALARVKSDKFAGALIIAVHHPPFTGGSTHGGSPRMLRDIDNACKKAGILAARGAGRTCAQLSALYAHGEQFSDSVYCGGLRRAHTALKDAGHLPHSL